MSGSKLDSVLKRLKRGLLVLPPPNMHMYDLCGHEDYMVIPKGMKASLAKVSYVI